MSITRPRLSLVNCKRKIRYGHEKTAINACAEMEKRGSTGLTAYFCGICLGWHIGHENRLLVLRIERTTGGRE